MSRRVLTKATRRANRSGFVRYAPSSRRGVIQVDAKVRRGSTQAAAARVVEAPRCGKPSRSRSEWGSLAFREAAAYALPRSTAPKESGSRHNIFYALEGALPTLAEAVKVA